MSDKALEKNGIKIWGGMKQTARDERDAEFGSLFGLPSLSELPPSFMVGTLGIKDQKDTDFCTAFGTTTASEAQEGVFLSPEFQFAMTKKITGAPVSEWGAQIRDALKSTYKIGSLPDHIVPDELRYDGTNREKIADYRNWNDELVATAAAFKKSSFARVTGQYDMFDNIRATIWQANAKSRKTGSSSDMKVVITGAVWKHAWTTAKDGIIPDGQFSGGFGHCFDIVGWDVINGETYLVAQLSNSDAIGNKGYYYFSRTVANRELPYGDAFTLVDMDKNTLMRLSANKMPATSLTVFISRIAVAVAQLLKLFKK